MPLIEEVRDTEALINTLFYSLSSFSKHVTTFKRRHSSEPFERRWRQRKFSFTGAFKRRVAAAVTVRDREGKSCSTTFHEGTHTRKHAILQTAFKQDCRVIKI